MLKEAVLMYEGMTGVISSDKPLEEVTIHDLSPGLCGYTFSLPLDSQGLSLAWTMNDDKDTGLFCRYHMIPCSRTIRILFQPCRR